MARIVHPADPVRAPVRLAIDAQAGCSAPVHLKWTVEPFGDPLPGKVPQNDIERSPMGYQPDSLQIRLRRTVNDASKGTRHTFPHASVTIAKVDRQPLL